VLSSSYAIYYGQMSPGQLSSQLAATGAVFVRYPWNDANGDGFVQPNEVNTTGAPLSRSTAYDPFNPASTTAPTTVDNGVRDDRTREFIVGFDRQLNSQMAVGGNYIWRKYDDFVWNDTVGLSSADYRAVNYQATTCPAGARCEPIVYYEPTIPLPSANIYTNRPDRSRDFNGLELTFQKRMANRWAANFSYAYNNAIEHFDSPASYEDPTCVVATCPGSFQYAPESAGSGVPELQVVAEGQRPREHEVGHQPCAELPRPPGLPLPGIDPDAEPRQQRRHGAGQSRPAGRRALRQPEHVRHARRQDVPLRIGDPDSGDGPVQPDQQQHGPGAEPPAGGGEREPRERHHRAARRSLRHQRSLVVTQAA
jgi:hypothetical protein